MERKLRYIEAEVKKDDVPIPDNLTELPRAPNPREIINLEVRSPDVKRDVSHSIAVLFRAHIAPPARSCERRYFGGFEGRFHDETSDDCEKMLMSVSPLM